MIKKEILVKLYVEKGKSMQEIADVLGCSLNKVKYWMDKYDIKIRNRSEAVYLKNNPNGDPFKLKEKLSQKDMVLLGVGLGLWWGEGSKLHQGTLRLGNSDPDLIKKYLEFLYEICGVEKGKVKFGLQVFSDMDPEDAKQYWMKKLNVSSEQFYPKIIVTKSGSIGTYRYKTQHGVLTVYCANVKLRKKIDEMMELYCK